MEDRVIQFRVGVVIVATCLITVILLIFFGEFPTPFRHQNTIYIRFREAPGVTVDTPVRKSGILIGRVTDVQLRDDGGVLVTAKVDPRRTLREDEICRISTGGLLGDATLEFVPSGEPEVPKTPLSDGAWVRGVVATNPLQVLVNVEEDVTQSLASIRGAGDDVGQAARSLNAFFENNRDQLARVLNKSEEAMGQFGDAMNAVNELTGDDQLNARLREALEQTPDLLADAREVLHALQRMASRADRNLENLEGLTEPLGERGEDSVDNVDQSIRQLNELLTQLAQFSQSLTSSEGTLGQLVNNPDLYQRLNRAAGNIEEVSRNLRPLITDARIFADKIARDPRQLGVKGALDRRQSGLKWLTRPSG